MIVYGDARSGNCYKIQLVASMLEIEHRWVHVDILDGGTQTRAFLSKNPNGKIPVVELASGTCLWESNAILYYFAQGTRLWPADPLQQARVLQWMFFEQYSHEPFIAVARFIAKFLGLPEQRQDEYAAKQSGGHKALRVMEHQLAQTPYIGGDGLTIADVALYAYTHVADEGGFDLASYGAIRRWLARFATEPGYVAMQR
jgi:glutathione S-transferase